MMPRSLPDELNEKDLRKYLEILVNEILKRMNSKVSEKDKNEIVNNLMYAIQNGDPSNSINRESLNDPVFLKKLVVKLAIASALAELNTDPKMIAMRKQKGKESGLDKELTPEAFIKMLTPQDLKKINESIMELFKMVMDDLENKDGLIKMPTPKPGMSPKKEEDDEDEVLDKNEQLMAYRKKANELAPFLATNYMDGCIPYVVSIAPLNYNAFRDMNPNPGVAPIDQFDQMIFSFSGKENKTAINNFCMEGSIEVESLMKDVDNSFMYAAKGYTPPGGDL